MDNLHNHTLALAEGLLVGDGFGGAAWRRAVSSAYYALFQRLSSLCAARLSGQTFASEEYLRLYRALEHKQVRSTLNKSVFKADLGARFEQLQDARQWADYSLASHLDPDLARAGAEFSTTEAEVYVNRAREAVQFVNSLDNASQLKLAVLLITRDR